MMKRIVKNPEEKEKKRNSEEDVIHARGILRLSY